MSSNNSIDFLAREILGRLYGLPNSDIKSKDPPARGKSASNSKDKNGISPNITPAQALVAIALLGGILEVNSILVDKSQVVQILLEGSLKKPNNNKDKDIEKLLDSIGNKSFDDVVKALINRLS